MNVAHAQQAWFVFIEPFALGKLRKLRQWSIFDAPGRCLAGRQKEFLSSVTSLIDKEILGTEENLSQWTLSLGENQKDVGTLRLDNNRTRRIIENLDILIDLTAVDNDRKILWKRSMDDLRQAIHVI